ncbi:MULTISPECIES: DUF2474 domain-containing protein [Cupriavidus]|jgi:hypothetical protein|uniref:DUF2474 domain-containing protein n=1 Tax=Cupriavidus pauculus TaxID=82633 RepID=A0A5P2H3E2_9BURK|nr:DUF2474 domain-containing protein [Cupriavidus pauculus]QET02035.1 DUF2474 domain-containing protein [Cupriavidus pauculus]
MNDRHLDNAPRQAAGTTGATEAGLGLRLGWMALLWLGGVGTVFVFAMLMRLLMRLGGLVA